jgi:hypothetical protein
MSRRLIIKQSPRLERLEGRCLLSIGLSTTASAPATPFLPPVGAALAPVHATGAPGVGGAGLHALCERHAPRSSHLNLVAVNTRLAVPVGRVQVDNGSLQSGTKYPMMSILGVMNATGRVIPRGSLEVTIPGSSFDRTFPEQDWRQGQVLAFFSTTSAGTFEFHLGGSPVSINPNNHPDVTYQPTVFNTTLGKLINGPAFGGRFQLVSHG